MAVDEVLLRFHFFKHLSSFLYVKSVSVLPLDKRDPEFWMKQRQITMYCFSLAFIVVIILT